MKRRLFWGFLVSVNVLVVLLLAVDHCDCGGASFWEVFVRFGPWASIVGGAFALFTLPIAIAWRAAERRWGIWRPISVPKMVLASVLVGSALYGIMDHKWNMDERAEMSATGESAP